MNHLSTLNVEMLEDLLSSVDSFTTLDFAQVAPEDSPSSNPPANWEQYNAGDCGAFCIVA